MKRMFNAGVTSCSCLCCSQSIFRGFSWFLSWQVNRNPRQRRSVATKKALAKRGVEPTGKAKTVLNMGEIHVEP